MERLTIRHSPSSVTLNKLANDCTVLHKLADYEDAEEQGLLHIAPLKNGTPIWYLDVMPFEEKVRVKKTSYLYGETEYSIGELGKDFWTSREEAGQALAEMQKG